MNWADLPTHQPECFDAPIPGRVWYGGCTDDCPKVLPSGVCAECGAKACPECGRENCSDHEWPDYPDYDPDVSRVEHHEGSLV